MLKEICVVAVLALTASAENLFDNSTMDTTGGWKGSKKFAKEETAKPQDQVAKKTDTKENRIIIVSAKKREVVSFSQEVSSKGLTDVVVTFRYRTKDYSGRGLEVRGTRQDRSSTYSSYQIVADGQWHEVRWKFDQIRNSNKMDFSFILLEGEGDLHFDDITVEKAE